MWCNHTISQGSKVKKNSGGEGTTKFETTRVTNIAGFIK